MRRFFKSKKASKRLAPLVSENWVPDGFLDSVPSELVVVDTMSLFCFKDTAHAIAHRIGAPAYLNKWGDKQWFFEGKLHREDGPAEETRLINGKFSSAKWYVHGQLHRLDGPAIININQGTESWYIHGKKHRVGGPADIKANGVHEWWQNGKKHREDGPAVLHSDGRQEWYWNGNRHRLDGPALNLSDRQTVGWEMYRKSEWWLFGRESNQQAVEAFQTLIAEAFTYENVATIPYEVLESLFLSSQEMLISN